MLKLFFFEKLIPKFKVKFFSLLNLISFSLLNQISLTNFFTTRNRLFYASRNPNSEKLQFLSKIRSKTVERTRARARAQKKKKKEKQKRKEKIKVTREIARNHTHCSESKNIPRNAFAVRPNTTRSFFVRD